MREKFIAVVLASLLMPAQAQYTVPYRTYHGATGPCTTHTQTVTTWTSAQSITSTDSNYTGDAAWANPGNIGCAPASGSCHASIWTNCATSALCSLPELVGTSAAQFTIPSTASLTSMSFSWTWLDSGNCDLGTSNCDTYTWWVDLCVGATWSSCTVSQRISGQRTNWFGAGSPTETYTAFSMSGLTPTEINTALNVGIVIKSDFQNQSHSVTDVAHGWSVTVTYCS